MYYWPPEQQDWCWLKAQGIAESSLVTTAVSPVGAQGVMQIMPATLADLQRQSQMDGNVFEARYNIIMGARYMAQSMDFWIFDRTDECRRTYGAGRLQCRERQYPESPGTVRRRTLLGRYSALPVSGHRPL